MTKMIAMTIPEPGAPFRREERAIPEPGRREVRLRVLGGDERGASAGRGAGRLRPDDERQGTIPRGAAHGRIAIPRHTDPGGKR